MVNLRYFSDSMRHLVCWPYSEENLHKMAQALNIHRCWFSASKPRVLGSSMKPRYAHYDIPKRRIQEIANRTEVVSPRVILAIVKGYDPPLSKAEMDAIRYRASS